MFNWHFIYLFLVVLSFAACQLPLVVAIGGLLLFAVRGLLTVVASLAAEHGI